MATKTYPTTRYDSLPIYHIVVILGFVYTALGALSMFSPSLMLNLMSLSGMLPILSYATGEWPALLGSQYFSKGLIFLTIAFAKFDVLYMPLFYCQIFSVIGQLLLFLFQYASYTLIVPWTVVELVLTLIWWWQLMQHKQSGMFIQLETIVTLFIPPTTLFNSSYLVWNTVEGLLCLLVPNIFTSILKLRTPPVEQLWIRWYGIQQLILHVYLMKCSMDTQCAPISYLLATIGKSLITIAWTWSVFNNFLYPTLPWAVYLLGIALLQVLWGFLQIKIDKEQEQQLHEQ